MALKRFDESYEKAEMEEFGVELDDRPLSDLLDLYRENGSLRRELLVRNAIVRRVPLRRRSCIWPSDR